MEKLIGCMSCVAALGCTQIQQNPVDAVGRLYSIENVSAELGGVKLAPRGSEVSVPPFDAVTWKSDSYKNRLKIEFGRKDGDSYCRLAGDAEG
jgi:hypothetical protein